MAIIWKKIQEVCSESINIESLFSKTEMNNELSINALQNTYSFEISMNQSTSEVFDIVPFYLI